LENLGGVKKTKRAHIELFGKFIFRPIDITSEEKIKNQKARFFLGGSPKKAKSSMAISKIWGPLVLKKHN